MNDTYMQQMASRVKDISEFLILNADRQIAAVGPIHRVLTRQLVTEQVTCDGAITYRHGQLICWAGGGGSGGQVWSTPFVDAATISAPPDNDVITRHLANVTWSIRRPPRLSRGLRARTARGVGSRTRRTHGYDQPSVKPKRSSAIASICCIAVVSNVENAYIYETTMICCAFVVEIVVCKSTKIYHNILTHQNKKLYNKID